MIDRRLTHAIAAVVLIEAALLWPFAYRNGYGHGDISAMHMSLFVPQGGPAPVYGRSFSFEWYWLGSALRRAFSIPSETFPRVINMIAVGAATAGDVLLLLVLSTVFPVGAALVATLLWRFTPELWEVATYAHPLTLALPLFFGAVAVACRSRRRISAMLASALFFAAFAMRADALLFVPVVVAVAYVWRREATGAILRPAIVGGVVFFVVQQALAGFDLLSLVATSAGPSPSIRTWVFNIGVFAYGAGLISAIAGIVLIGARCLTRREARMRALTFGLALLPTCALWIPHGGAARHFAPVYLVLAVYLAAVVTRQFSGAVLRAAAVMALVAANAIAAEATFRSVPMPPASIQVVPDRRIVERVPLGNVWSNHAAKVRMNAVENAYANWAMRCTAGGAPVVFAQESPYLIVVTGTERYGAVASEGQHVFRIGETSPHLWMIDMPEVPAKSWWTDTQRFAASHGTDVVLLGPRIPKSLASAWRNQRPELGAGHESIAAIDARPCPSPKTQLASPTSAEP